MNPQYADMLSLKHHVSLTHPPMDRLSRAAQFMPFAALDGYEEQIEETGRETQKKPLLSQEEKGKISEGLRFLAEQKSPCPVRLTYFQKDAKKEGGEIKTIRGNVKRVKEEEKRLVLEKGIVIEFDEILSLKIQGFLPDFCEF